LHINVDQSPRTAVGAQPRRAWRDSADTYGVLRTEKLVKIQRQQIIFALDQYASATTQFKN